MPCPASLEGQGLYQIEIDAGFMETLDSSPVAAAAAVCYFETTDNTPPTLKAATPYEPSFNPSGSSFSSFILLALADRAAPTAAAPTAAPRSADRAHGGLLGPARPNLAATGTFMTQSKKRPKARLRYFPRA